MMSCCFVNKHSQIHDSVQCLVIYLSYLSHICHSLLSHSLSEHCHDSVSALCSQMAAEPDVLYKTSSRRAKQQNRDRLAHIQKPRKPDLDSSSS